MLPPSQSPWTASSARSLPASWGSRCPPSWVWSTAPWCSSSSDSWQWGWGISQDLLPHLLPGLLADLPLSAATSRTPLSVRDGTTKMLFLMSQNHAQVLSGMFNCFLMEARGHWPSRAQWLSSSPPLAMVFVFVVFFLTGWEATGPDQKKSRCFYTLLDKKFSS